MRPSFWLAGTAITNNTRTGANRADVAADAALKISKAKAKATKADHS
jgi:hypothetical protein